MTTKLWLLTGPLKQAPSDGAVALWQWLAKGRVRRVDNTQSTASRTLHALGHSGLNPDLAVYRFMAHADPAPNRWIAAADPVYLEPRLDHLCLHSLQVSGSELRRLQEHLNHLLADDMWALEAHGDDLYLVGTAPVPTSATPSAAIHGLLPNPFMPTGKDAAEYRRRISEFEMALHEHPVNLTRSANGQQPVNSLWLWGGGLRPETKRIPLPSLRSNDAHLRGLWRAFDANVERLPKQLSLETLADDTVVGPVSQADLPALLEQSRRALRAGKLAALTCLSLDGYVIEHRARDWLRVFRRPHKDFS